MKHTPNPVSPPSFSRTLAVCVLTSLVIGLPLIIWQGYDEAHRAGNFQLAIFGKVMTFALLLTAAIGGIAGCLVFTLRNLWWSSRR